ncbi:hypothetical protein [Saccharolobus sp. A20]|uniref:hypothetical protein n=1 Tax=Saccharolobus sp. A20 TaxID=1891280 RepID=UPI0012EA3B5F|nr:hypothetical protein [Sulfolobus sp. A20]
MESRSIYNILNCGIRLESKAISKFVYWTYFKRNVKGLYKWIFTIISYTDKAMYLVF